MHFVIANIQYHPSTGDVAVFVTEKDTGLLSFFIRINQADLPEAWVDTDVLARAQWVLDNDPLNELPRLSKVGHILELPEAQV